MIEKSFNRLQHELMSFEVSQAINFRGVQDINYFNMFEGSVSPYTFF